MTQSATNHSSNERSIREELPKQAAINYNLRQEILVISSDKLENVMLRYLKYAERKFGWATPASVSLTLFASIFMGRFRDVLGVSGDKWESIFIVTAVILGLYALVRLVNSICHRKKGSLDFIVAKLKDGGLVTNPEDASQNDYPCTAAAVRELAPAPDSPDLGNEPSRNRDTPKQARIQFPTPLAGTWILLYGPKEIRERATIDEDGNYYIGGQKRFTLVLQKYDPGKKIVWAKTKVDGKTVASVETLSIVSNDEMEGYGRNNPQHKLRYKRFTTE
jgi:hypothetical protein